MLTTLCGGAMKYLLILFHLFLLLLLLLCSPYYNKWCFNNPITIRANIRTIHFYSCSNFLSLSLFLFLYCNVHTNMHTNSLVEFTLLCHIYVVFCIVLLKNSCIHACMHTYTSLNLWFVCLFNGLAKEAVRERERK